MKTHVSTDNNILFWRLNGEILKVEPWGPDGARVRATNLSDFPTIPGALLESPATPDVAAVIQDGKGILTNGKLRAEVWPDGTLHFLNAQSGSVLLEEPEPIFNKPPARWYRPLEGSNLSKIDVHFRSQPREHIFGLGQHQHGLLDNKGAVIDLEQRNTEVCIPFYLSSLGYGFLWNNPGVGRVELGTNLTRWVMEATRGIDYYIVAGDTPAEILEKYIDATGHPPLLPDYALGFWQCKLRYRTQQELLSVVREYKQRGLPLAIIVSDFFHWHMMGDWAMDPRNWPDPAGMMKGTEGNGRGADGFHLANGQSQQPGVWRNGRAWAAGTDRPRCPCPHGHSRYDPRRGFHGVLLRRDQPRGSGIPLAAGEEKLSRLRRARLLVGCR